MQPDFRLDIHGSLCILTALTPAARDWSDDHLPEDALTFAGGVVIEPRYVEAILDGIDADGLIVGNL